MSDYSIWVLEYCYMPEVHKAFFTYGAFDGGIGKMPFCYVLLKGHGHVILIDVGFSYKDRGNDFASTFNIANWRPPSVVLAECGVKPGDVTHVFITHAHFDHMGSIDEFPNARFYIQERELSKWIWAMSLDRKFRWLMSSTDPVDIIRTVQLAREGRLVSIDGDREDVLPGIDLHAAFDSHTWGSMYIKVRNDGARNSEDCWVFAGDLIYSYENLRGTETEQKYIPVGLAQASQTNLLLAMDAMVSHANGDIRRVVPVHDPALKDVFPSRMSSEGLTVSELALAKGEASRV